MTVTRYRKRPVEVDTIQWTGDNETEVQAFTGGASKFYALDDADRENSDDPEATATVFDELHSTWVLVYTGQHIVRGVKGEFSPIAEDVLAETYELAAEPDESPLRDQVAAAIYEHNHPLCRWADATQHSRDTFRAQADAVLAVILPTTRLIGCLHATTLADVHRVIDLYERWVKAGPPPLGTSMSRWWDKRLVELHNAILPPADKTTEK
ncbi:hypothetical protein ACFZBC_08935 [Streptomyces luteogriseus]|uniref:hypothetical protein n=1 Tax=Streptomyces luteogriseus TaxID=68233 RepID=UPI0036E1B29F